MRIRKEKKNRSLHSTNKYDDDNDPDSPSAAHSLIGEKICRRAVTQFY